MYYFKRFIKKTLRYLLKPLSLIPMFVMIYVIFNFGSQDGIESAGLSLQVSKYIVLIYNKIFMKGLSNNELNVIINNIHPYVRKAAHITEYMLLAMSVSLPLYVYKIRGFWLVLWAGMFCVLIASIDEYHQTFIAGRVGDIHDVMIDSIGILIGIIIIQIICHIGRATIFHWLVLDE